MVSDSPLHPPVLRYQVMISDGEEWMKLNILGFTGKAGVQFFTQIKTVTQQWKDLPSQGVSLAMPTSQKA